MEKNWLLALFTTITIIGAGLFFAIHFYSKKHQAHFYVGVSGGNANVQMNNLNLGIAPIKNATMAPDWYEFTLHTDYYDYSLPLRLTPQTATVVDWQVATTLESSSGIFYELLPTGQSDALLTLTTIPDKAQVYLDDDTLTESFTPLVTKKLSPGQHTLTLSLPGFQTQTLPCKLNPGYELKLTVKLAQDE